MTSEAFDVARWISFGGLALLGGAWLLLTVWPAGRDDRRARRLVWTGWGAVAVGAVPSCCCRVRTPPATGWAKSPTGRCSTPRCTPTTGELHCVRLMLLGVLALLLARCAAAERRARRREELAGAAGRRHRGDVRRDRARGHHVRRRWLSLGGRHAAPAARWRRGSAGCVMLVAACCRAATPDELRAVLPVFSRVAFVAVVMLAVTGTYAAWRGVGIVAGAGRHDLRPAGDRQGRAVRRAARARQPVAAGSSGRRRHRGGRRSPTR